VKSLPRTFLAVALPVALAVALYPLVGRERPEPGVTAGLRRTEVLVEGLPESAFLRERAKRLVAREAAAGRWTLAEAAAMFAELNRVPPAAPRPVSPETPGHPLRHLPGRTDAELIALQVIAHVTAALPDEPPEQARAAGARLEAEYLAALREGGTIRLPDPDALPSARQLLEWARAAIATCGRGAAVGPRPAPPPPDS